jgi:hypothetical protein
MDITKQQADNLEQRAQAAFYEFKKAVGSREINIINSTIREYEFFGKYIEELTGTMLRRYDTTPETEPFDRYNLHWLMAYNAMLLLKKQASNNKIVRYIMNNAPYPKEYRSMRHLKEAIDNKADKYRYLTAIDAAKKIAETQAYEHVVKLIDYVMEKYPKLYDKKQEKKEETLDQWATEHPDFMDYINKKFPNE